MQREREGLLAPPAAPSNCSSLPVSPDVSPFPSPRVACGGQWPTFSTRRERVCIVGKGRHVPSTQGREKGPLRTRPNEQESLVRAEVEWLRKQVAEMSAFAVMKSEEVVALQSCLAEATSSRVESRGGLDLVCCGEAWHGGSLQELLARSEQECRRLEADCPKRCRTAATAAALARSELHVSGRRAAVEAARTRAATARALGLRWLATTYAKRIRRLQEQGQIHELGVLEGALDDRAGWKTMGLAESGHLAAAEAARAHAATARALCMLWLATTQARRKQRQREPAQSHERRVLECTLDGRAACATGPVGSKFLSNCFKDSRRFARGGA